MITIKSPATLKLDYESGMALYESNRKKLEDAIARISGRFFIRIDDGEAVCCFVTDISTSCDDSGSVWLELRCYKVVCHAQPSMSSARLSLPSISGELRRYYSADVFLASHKEVDAAVYDSCVDKANELAKTMLDFMKAEAASQ